MKFFTFSLAAAVLFATSEGAARAAFDGDLVPRLVGSTIITDGISDEDGSLATDVSVYQYTLGELSPGYTEDPGFQPQTTSGLPGSSYMGFNVATALLYWNGTGNPSFAPVSGDSAMEFYLGPSHVFITGTSGPQNGFVLQQLTSDGAGHRHLNAQLLGEPSPAGSYFDSLGNSYDAPADGIYAFGIRVTDSLNETTNPAVYQSDIKWIVYDENLSDATLGVAADSLPGSIVPEPGTLAMLAFATITLMGRRWNGVALQNH